MASHVEIEQLNIYHATLLAMQRACYNLFSICKLRPAAIVVDAMPLILKSNTYTEIPVYHFPKGEDYSSSIAAASIMAKVYRDQLMSVYHQFHPQFNWSKNVGYGTLEHRQLVNKIGPSPLHRRSFLS